jgi:K+-transporting ATPase ATPase A chain
MADLIFLALGLAVAIGWPLGLYMSRVWSGERTWLDPVLTPVEKLFYTASGVDPKKSQSWFGYAGALLAFNFLGFLVVYAVLRLQGVLPLNPQGFHGLSGHLSFTRRSASSPTSTGRAMPARRRCRRGRVSAITPA